MGSLLSPSQECHPFTPSYLAHDLVVSAELLYRYGGMNQREIGELMGIDYSAVSVMRKRVSVLKEKDRHLSAGIERVKREL